MPAITPHLLQQARKEAGFSLEDAAQEIGYKASTLEKLEAGEKAPSSLQLEKIAKFYGYPSLAFLFEKLPERPVLGEDFRTFQAGQNLSFEENRNLQTLLEKTRAQQDLAKELRQDDNMAPLPWIGGQNLSLSPEALAEKIKEILNFSLKAYRDTKPTERFKFLRLKVEESGVFVLLAGAAASPKQTLGLNVFRGIALSDPLAPFILLNDHENEPARVFTLLHEMAHLCLGSSGISGKIGENSQKKVEHLCNAAAEAILIHPEDKKTLKEIWKKGKKEALRKWALAHGVSLTLCALLLLREKEITPQIYAEIQNEQFKRNKPKRQEAGGPNYYIVRKNKIGMPLVRLAEQALNEERLVPTRAAILLGVKATNVYPLIESRPNKRKAIA